MARSTVKDGWSSGRNAGVRVSPGHFHSKLREMRHSSLVGKRVSIAVGFVERTVAYSRIRYLGSARTENCENRV